LSNTVHTIEQLLQDTFKPSLLTVADESWKHAGHSGVQEHGGGHYHLCIKAEAFKGKSRVETHRMINRTLAGLFPASIHALSIDIQ